MAHGAVRSGRSRGFTREGSRAAAKTFGFRSKLMSGPRLWPSLAVTVDEDRSARGGSPLPDARTGCGGAGSLAADLFAPLADTNRVERERADRGGGPPPRGAGAAAPWVSFPRRRVSSAATRTLFPRGAGARFALEIRSRPRAGRTGAAAPRACGSSRNRSKRPRPRPAAPVHAAPAARPRNIRAAPPRRGRDPPPTRPPQRDPLSFRFGPVAARRNELVPPPGAARKEALHAVGL